MAMGPATADHDHDLMRQVALVLLAICVAWLASKYLIYPKLGVPDYAPMILRPIAGFLTAWLLIRQAGQAWSDFGLRREPGLRTIAISSIVLYAVVYAANRFAVPQIAAWLSFQGGPSILGYIRGNEIALLGWLAVGWGVGGFCEELLFRGFLLNKIRLLVGGGIPGATIGIVAQAALFGLLHLYQGAFGFVFAFTMAVVSGIAYFLFRCNLWPLIIVHGAFNSIGIYGIYAS